jgi:Tetratricopeptide repeat.
MSGRGSEPVRSAPFFDHGLFLLHLNRGKEDLRKGLHDDARREFEEARRFRATDPEVLSNLALAMFHLGHLDEAERITRGLLVSHADSVPLLFNLGLILFKAGRAEAREPLERVLALAPGHRKAHLTVGLLLQREGRLAEANRHFEAAGSERKAGFDGDDTITRTARSAASGPAEPGAFVPSVKPEAFDDSRTRREPSTQPIQAPQPPPEPLRAVSLPPAVSPVVPPGPARTSVGASEAAPGGRAPLSYRGRVESSPSTFGAEFSSGGRRSRDGPASRSSKRTRAFRERSRASSSAGRERAESSSSTRGGTFTSRSCAGSSSRPIRPVSSGSTRS